MFVTVLFVVFAAIALGSAIGVVISRNPVHSALWLVGTLLAIAGFFVLQKAYLLSAVQVIVYASAIVVLFLFVIMLLGVDNAENLRIEPFRIQRPLAAVVGVGTFALVVTAAIVARGADVAVRGAGLEIAGTNGADHDGNIKALARDLFSDHVLAFELTSVLLVIAVVGTVVLARKPRKGELKGGEA